MVAVGSLVVAGLLSLAVVVGRLPWIAARIADPLIYKRCLVVHVVLALIVWFYAFLGALSAQCAPDDRGGRLGRATAWVVAFGVALMLAGAIVPGAQPVLANYVPVIDHPLFLGGLACVFAGLLANLLGGLLAPSGGRSGGPTDDVVAGIRAAGVALVLAAATWVAARTAIPAGLDTWTHYEFSTWGAGHAMQVANACGMLAAWLWLLHHATGRQVLGATAARAAFTLLVAPHFIMPLLLWRGPLNHLYVHGSTNLMRWGIFPVVLAMLAIGVRHLVRHRGPGREPAAPLARACTAGFAASAGLTLLGFLLGAMIRESSTLIPAHYHASLGAVTAAFMAGSFLLICQRCDAGDWRVARILRHARGQLLLFGAGQTVFAVGFAIGGLSGLGRKSYGAEQHVRSPGELTGLGVMGLGGLVAVAAGLWFLFLAIGGLRAWASNHRSAASVASANPNPKSDPMPMP